MASQAKPDDSARTYAGAWPAVFCPCPGPALRRSLWAVATGKDEEAACRWAVAGYRRPAGPFHFHSAKPRPQHQHAGSAPHALTRVGRERTVRTCSDPQDGMTWNGSTTSMEHSRRTRDATQSRGREPRTLQKSPSHPSPRHCEPRTWSAVDRA